jgi:RNA polymerase sigma factor (sigma-70 family)
MTRERLNGVIAHLRKAVLCRDAEVTDGQLLGRFLDRRDDGAFEALLRRHGPMVFGVCRRLLGNFHDAEEAFQATFLVLAHKAASVVSRERVGPWLHAVAYRTALKARTAAAVRRLKERKAARSEAVEGDVAEAWQPLLDQELSRLPEKYRAPIVLCDLEGKTYKQAAQQLGVPPGTVAGRLARGRALLARRLTRRGVVLPAGALGLLLAQGSAAAGMPAELVSSTIRTAIAIAAGDAAAAGAVSAQVAALTKGVLQAMFITKWKPVLALVLVLAVAALAAGWQALRAQAVAELPAKDATPAQEADQADDEAPVAKAARLPAGPMPFAALASIDKKGRLALQMSGASSKEEQMKTKGSGGQDVLVVKETRVTMWHYYRPEKVRAFDTRGKKVSAEQLILRLRKKTMVLVSADGKEVDAAYLGLFKEGLLVLVVPLPREQRLLGLPAQHRQLGLPVPAEKRPAQDTYPFASRTQ